MAKTKEKISIPESGTVYAEPTKNFFVTMLTRDIALVDAIMDLVDNCIDGVHRSKQGEKKNSQAEPYAGYYANLLIDSKSFQITDNCGGIPFEVAEKYAFRMGRDADNHTDDKIETVGMYGIGMKRAIFKMGKQAEITTWHNDESYSVKIPPDWSTKRDWTFNYERVSANDIKRIFNASGTQLKVTQLSENISAQFADKSGFLSDLANSLRNHYGYIIQKGFTIKLNGTQISPIEIKLLTSTDDKAIKAIKPYVYSGTINDVEISVAIGFYREPPSQDEVDKELEGTSAERKSENAGVTVLCNERVVLYCDKTLLTGWGEAPVPKYHTQFVAIAGVVHFRSKNAYNLPVTTTKRGLDTSSPVYAEARVKIRDGLKAFTQFTNNWKTKSEERDRIFKATKAVTVLEPVQDISNSFELKKGARGNEGLYQLPQLPKPTDAFRRDNVTISFSRERKKVESIAKYFLDDIKKPASEVGGYCFDELYSKVENP